MPASKFEELKPLFQPESIAIIGASNTEGKWGEHDGDAAGPIRISGPNLPHQSEFGPGYTALNPMPTF